MMKKEFDEIIVSARLVAVNSEKPDVEIKGFVRVGINHARKIAIALFERVRSAYDRIKVSAKRVR